MKVYSVTTLNFVPFNHVIHQRVSFQVGTELLSAYYCTTQDAITIGAKNIKRFTLTTQVYHFLTATRSAIERSYKSKSCLSGEDFVKFEQYSNLVGHIPTQLDGWIYSTPQIPTQLDIFSVVGKIPTQSDRFVQNHSELF